MRVDWIPAFAGMTLLGVRREFSRYRQGTGFFSRHPSEGWDPDIVTVRSIARIGWC